MNRNSKLVWTPLSILCFAAGCYSASPSEKGSDSETGEGGSSEPSVSGDTDSGDEDSDSDTEDTDGRDEDSDSDTGDAEGRGVDSDSDTGDTDGREEDSDSDTGETDGRDEDSDSDAGSSAVCASYLYEPCCLETPPAYQALCERVKYDLNCPYYYCCEAMDMAVGDKYFDGCMVGPHCLDPSYCGDGVLNGEREKCDDGNTVSGDGCSSECVVEPQYLCETPGSPCQILYVCGNGVLEPGEVCDDGNANSGDGCSGDCETQEPGFLCAFPGTICIPVDEFDTDWAPVPRCGDGIVQAEIGEVCDDGGENGLYGHCNYACNGIVGCGDGLLQAAYEECDDGENIGGYNRCGPSCTVEQYCGDGVVQPDDEACDDGEKNGQYGRCNVSCRDLIRCGDGTVQRPDEDCDDGNDVDDDTCDNRCRCGAPRF